MKSLHYRITPASLTVNYIQFVHATVSLIQIGKFLEPNKKERKTVYCKLCPKVLKYSGKTTNLWFHLESSHRAEFKLLIELKEKRVVKLMTAYRHATMLERATSLSQDSPMQVHGISVQDQYAIL